MSNDSLESSACRAEFTEAVRLEKNVLPIIIRPRTRIERAGDTAEAIREINWIDLSGGFDDDRNVNRLHTSISHLLQTSTGHPLSVTSMG